MKLFMSYNSPYARKVRVFLRELDLEDRVDEVAVDPRSNPEELIALNPASKIPALQTDDGLAVHDSRVILSYLGSLKPESSLYPRCDDPMRWPAMTLAAHCESILDAAVAWRQEILRQPGERSVFWQTRWQQQIERALDALPDRIDSLPAYADYARMLTAIALEYLDFRHGNLDWRRNRPALQDLQQQWGARSSMVETRPPV